MDTNTDNFELRKLESELAYYKVKVTRLEEENEKLLRANFFSQDKKNSVKKNGETMNLETDLEICENRIKELEEENKKLQEENKKNAEQIAKNAVESDDERVKAAYKDGYGTAVVKMSACLQEMKFDSVVTVEQGPITLKVEQKSHEDEFEKVLAENSGKCYFDVYSSDLLDKKLSIVLALSKTYEVSPMSVENYLDKFVKNKKLSRYTTILRNVSEDICRTLENHLQRKQIGYSWDSV